VLTPLYLIEICGFGLNGGQEQRRRPRCLLSHAALWLKCNTAVPCVTCSAKSRKTRCCLFDFVLLIFPVSVWSFNEFRFLDPATANLFRFYLSCLEKIWTLKLHALNKRVSFYQQRLLSSEKRVTSVFFLMTSPLDVLLMLSSIRKHRKFPWKRWRGMIARNKGRQNWISQNSLVYFPQYHVYHSISNSLFDSTCSIPHSL
jgi:hypothetical protein